MKAPIDDAVTEPDGLVRVPPTTDERAIGALLEGLDDPQPIAPARVSGSNLLPRGQYETALLPDAERRHRRKGAVLGLVLGLLVTFIVGALVVKTMFNGRNADAASAATAVGATNVPATAATSVSTSRSTSTTAAAPIPIPTVAPPTAALTDLPVVAPPSSPSASAAAPSTAKRPGHPAGSSSPGEPRRGYGLTSDEP